MRLVAKQRIKEGLIRTGLLGVANRFARAGTAILRYHSVQEDPGRVAQTIGTAITHSQDAFDRQMAILARHYHPVSLDDVLNSLQQGSRLRRKSVAVTFDDGYADNLEIAAPILAKYGIPATVYLIVESIDQLRAPWFSRLRHAMATTRKSEWRDSVDHSVRQLGSPAERRAAFLVASRRLAQLCGDRQESTMGLIESELDVDPLLHSGCPMLSWEQARALRGQGHIIGSHTMTHANSAYIGSSELRAELLNSKKRIEEEVGGGAVHFSYPAPILEPHFTSESIRWCEELGYRTAVTCKVGLVRVGDNPLALQRIFAPQDLVEFQWALENSFLGRRV
jgi:peptidoglycan/xylan/chitin deacetylase (PgdA/CDA1 family)